MSLRQSMISVARFISLPKIQYSLIFRPLSLWAISSGHNNSVKPKAIPSYFRSCPYSSDSINDATKRVGELVKSSRIVLFMKGDPDEPRCGFSNAVCRILEMHGILDRARQAGNHKLFSSYNVLADEELRSAAKAYSDWPTFPQVFFDGEFVGGCDILLDMHKSGKLTSELERLGIGSALKQKSEQEST